MTQDFAKENETIITFGIANQDTSIYKNGESPLNEELLYYVNTPSKGIFYFRFSRIDDQEFRVFIDNGSISLTLNQNLERCTNYPSNDLIYALIISKVSIGKD